LFANTLEQKDNTLFLGNIKTANTDISEDLDAFFNTRKIYTYKSKESKDIPLMLTIEGTAFTNWSTYL
jgi:hypothetical protein